MPGITIDNIAQTDEFCENMDTDRSTGIDFSNAPLDLPAGFVEFVGKKGTQLKDTAAGFEMKVGAGASSLLATAADLATASIPEPTVDGHYVRQRYLDGPFTKYKWSSPEAWCMPKDSTGTTGDVCTLDIDKNATGSGLQLSGVARRDTDASVAGNMAMMKGTLGDVEDSDITKASVSNALVGTLPVDAVTKTDAFAVAIGGCVYKCELGATKVCTLPAISSVPVGKFYNIIVGVTGPGISLTITPTGADQINGGATATVTPPPVAKFNCLVVNNGSGWICSLP